MYVRNKFLYVLGRKIKKIAYWIELRTIHRNHVVKTGLPPSFLLPSELILHANFSILKKHVEKEIGHYARVMSADYKKTETWKEKYIPYYNPGYREDAIRHLEWASTLDDPNLPPMDQSPDQAATARETLALYLWWVDIRPARSVPEPPPYDDQGLESFAPFDPNFNHNAEDFKEYERVLAENFATEAKWVDEDTEMLIRLIKIRESLWI